MKKTMECAWGIIMILFLVLWIATEAWYEYSLRKDVRDLKSKVMVLENK